MPSKKYDVLLVGLGLAGIHFSFACRQKGIRVLHIHASTIGESTAIAAGLINPITGRRYVKSWKIDEFMPFAIERYQAFEILLGNTYMHDLDIVRTLNGPGDENTWLSKTADPFLQQYMMDAILEGQFNKGIKQEEMFGQLTNCLRVDIKQLQEDYIALCREEGSILEEAFRYEDIEIGEAIQYGDIAADHIVFAEGWRVAHNPFFQVNAFAPAKGELFLVHAPELQLDKAYKKEQFIVPLGQDMYWVGATYEWNNFDPIPTEKMYDRIKSKLDDVICVPYTIQTHMAGLRPSSRDRKPVLGHHATHQHMHIFNGMGTKGTSLAPYFSSILLDSILSGKTIPEEVDVQRFYAS